MTALDTAAPEDCRSKGSVAQWIWALVLIVSFVLLLSSGLRIQRVLSSRGWPTTQGMVTVSTLEHTPLGRSMMKYGLQLRYSYSVQGTRYESGRLSFAGSTGYVGRTKIETRVQQALKTYTKGAAVTVHYHPTKLGVAVLDTEVPGYLYKRFLLAIGMGVLAVVGFRRRWTMQTDYLSKPYDPKAPMTFNRFILGALGLAVCVAIAWIWWELIKKYAGFG